MSPQSSAASGSALHRLALELSTQWVPEHGREVWEAQVDRRLVAIAEEHLRPPAPLDF